MGPDSGTRLWERVESSDDEAVYGVAATDEAFVAVGSIGSGEEQVAAIYLYAPDGTPIWSRTWDLPQRDARPVARFAFPREDGSLIIGLDVSQPYGGGPCQWCPRRWLIGMSAGGDVEWDRELQIAGYNWLMAGSPTGELAVVGGAEPAQLEVADLDATGNEVGRAMLTLPQRTMEVPSVSDVALAADSTLVVASLEPTFEAGDSVKLGWISAWNASRELLWVHALGVVRFDARIALFPDGDVIVAATAHEVSDGYLVRLAAEDGAEIWAASHPSIESDLLVDCAGNIIEVDSVVTKFDPDGTELWSSRVGGLQLRGAIVPSSGTIFVGSNFDQRPGMMSLALAP